MILPYKQAYKDLLFQANVDKQKARCFFAFWNIAMIFVLPVGNPYSSHTDFPACNPAGVTAGHRLRP